MVESNRDFEVQAPPEVMFDVTKFSSLKNLEFGDKGEIKFSGVITRERKSDCGVLKTIKIVQSSPKKEARI